MKKITLILAALVSMGTANAQSKVIVQNDPMGDAGTNGVDIKNVSYTLSTDKKDVTFTFEGHAGVMTWNYSGFMFYIDENMNPSTGLSTDGANKSMKADRSISLVNMMGMWMASVHATDTTKNGDISSSVVFTTVNNTTWTVKIPLNKLDSDGDGKFNMIIASIVAGTGGQSMSVDDLPNTGYSTMNMLSTTGINTVVSNKIELSTYPNPAVNNVNFISDVTINGTIYVYDVAGKVVANQSINGKGASISVHNLNNSIYIYRVINNNQELMADGKFNVLR